MSSTPRNSNIEALKLFGAFLIVLSHVLPCDGDSSAASYVALHLATRDTQTFLLILIRYLGQIGNAVFIVSSAWFLVNSNTVHVRKMKGILLDTLLLAWLPGICILLLHLPLRPEELPALFLPMTFENNWFVSCYLLCYLLHPWLNAIINSIPSPKNAQRCLLLLLALYGIWQPFFAGSFYYTKLVGFLLLYLLTGMIRKYPDLWWSENRDRSLLIGCLAALPIFLTGISFLGLHHWFFYAKMMDFCTFILPLIFLPVIAAFRMTERKPPADHPWINRLSSLTLLIYLFSENFTMRQYVRPYVFSWIHTHIGYQHIAGICLLLGCVVFVISLPVCALYRQTLGRLTHR